MSRAREPQQPRPELRDSGTRTFPTLSHVKTGPRQAVTFLISRKRKSFSQNGQQEAPSHSRPGEQSCRMCLKQLAGVQRTLRGEHHEPPMCTWGSGRREHTQSQGSRLVAHEGSAPTARLRMDPGGACESAVPTVGLTR